MHNYQTLNARKGSTIMHGALGKEELSGMNHQDRQNHHAWSTREGIPIIHGALGKSELSNMDHYRRTN